MQQYISVIMSDLDIVGEYSKLLSTCASDDTFAISFVFFVHVLD